MRELLIIYVVYSMCAIAALVWSTLNQRRGWDLQTCRDEVKYVAISDYFLLEWAASVPGLVILDVHLDRGIGGWEELASYWLPTSLTDLPSLLEWLPPASMVVLCCRAATKEFDTQSKIALMQAGIGTIYFLDESPVFQTNHYRDHDVTTRDVNRELRKITMRETRRGL